MKQSTQSIIFLRKILKNAYVLKDCSDILPFRIIIGVLCFFNVLNRFGQISASIETKRHGFSFLMDASTTKKNQKAKIS